MTKFFSRSKFAVRTLGAGAVAAAALLASDVAYGQGYTTSFDNLASGSLSGQDSWDTNDADNGVTANSGQSIGQSDFVGVIQNYSASGTDYWAYLGGLNHTSTVPGTSPVFLFRPFTLGVTAAYAFNVDMSISSSTTYPNRDTFSWNFRNSMGTSIFSLNFDPVTGTGNPFAIRYSVNGGAETSSGNGLISNSIYHLTVSVNTITNLVSVSLTPTSGTAIPITSFTAVGALTVAQVAAEWTVANTTGTVNGGLENAGGNSLIFNNYAVTVPEPSTWVLLGLAGFFVVGTIRRRARA